METFTLLDYVVAYATLRLLRFLSDEAKKNSLTVNAIADQLGITHQAYRDLRHTQDSLLQLKILIDIASNKHLSLAVKAFQKWNAFVAECLVCDQAPVLQVPPDRKLTALLRLCCQGRINVPLYATLTTLDASATNANITLTASPTFFDINDTRCTDDDVMRVTKIIIKGNIDL